MVGSHAVGHTVIVAAGQPEPVPLQLLAEINVTLSAHEAAEH